ncbi:MAG: anaerobic sulfite reductase subunit A, partial [Cetobacterium sp.]
MKKLLTNDEFNTALLNLSKEYDIYAPVTLPFKGTFSDTDLVKYEKITKLEEINLKDKSYYSAKEILLPIRQTIFYFNENEFKKPEGRTKKALVLLRSCDLHAIERVDNI